jgi:hypothetical protein
MPVTIAPSTEACQALVDRINAGTEYALDVLATYSRVDVNPLEQITERKVDVVAIDEKQLSDTFDVEGRTSHTIAIWIREKLDENNPDPEAIDALCLVVRKIFQRVNNWDSADRRVRVWEVDEETRMTPDKQLLRQASLFAAKIVLRVEVEASP